MKKKPVLLIVAAIVGVLFIVFALPVIRLGVGLVNKGVFEKKENRTYNGDAKDNLKALYTALMFVHESDGQFPEAGKWMDAVKTRIQTGDMTAEEAQKKLIDPTLGGRPGAYGFAFNDACAGKYKDDIKDKKTILIFQSSDTKWDAHGDPAKLAPKPPRGPSSLGITLAGEIVSL